MNIIKFIFGQPEKILYLNDIERKLENYNSCIPNIEKRKKIQILVIDDLIFNPEHNLRNNQFQLSIFKDIQRIDQVKDYDIILCDVNEIGLELSEESQGAFIIKEIKKNYPQKIVIAYTAGSRNSNLVIAAREYADDYIRKDASIEAWVDLLDHCINEFTHPIIQWKKQRTLLLDSGMELGDLMQIEQIILKNLKLIFSKETD